jgi:hypothetical protein
MFTFDSPDWGRIVYRVISVTARCNNCGRMDGIRFEVLYNDRSGLDTADGFMMPNDRLGTQVTSCGAGFDAEMRKNPEFRAIPESREADYLRMIEEW